MTLNGNEINLPTSVILPFRDKFRARKLIRKQPLLLHMMLKQGKTWFTLEMITETQTWPMTMFETTMNGQTELNLFINLF